MCQTDASSYYKIQIKMCVYMCVCMCVCVCVCVWRGGGGGGIYFSLLLMKEEKTSRAGKMIWKAQATNINTTRGCR